MGAILFRRFKSMETSRFFGGPEGSVPEYTQPQFAEVLSKIFSDGVFPDIDNELEVVECDPVALAVRVNTGEAWIQGFWYQNTAYLTKSLAAADPDNDRIDRIVLRLDTTTNFKISAEVLTGTPAGSPAAPALTQTSSIYEISLAQVLVEAGVTSISNAKITDERDFVESKGLASVVSIKVDTINENTSNAGVTVDGVKPKEQSIITTSITSSATPTPARASKKTEYIITALEANATFGAPTGTPANGDLLLITVKDNGTARTLAFNEIYTAPYSAAKPTTTTISKTLIMLFRYNSASSKWELLYTDMEV